MKAVLSILLVVATATSVRADRCLGQNNGITFPNVDNCEAYALCFNGLEINLECPENHWYDFLRNICLPENEAMCYKLQHNNLQCPKDGLYAIPNPAGCEKYFICFDGESIERECFAGLHWSQAEQQCMEPALAGCVQADEPIKCPAVNAPGEVVFIPSAESCSKFYVCFNGEPVPRECAAGLSWEQSLRLCIPSSKSTCTTSNIVKTVPQTAVVNMETICSEIIFDVIEYPGNNRRYIVCIAGRATQRRCNKGLSFNALLRACVPARMTGIPY